MNTTHSPWIRYAFVLLVCACVALGGLAHGAVTVDLTAVKDASLYEEDDRTANGSGRYIFAGNTDNAETRRALLEFDFSSIPPGSTITSVSLSLYMSRTQAGPVNVSLHRSLNDWTQGPSNPGGQEGGGDSAELNDVTWRYRSYDPNDEPGSPQWSTTGGDFVAGASATTSVDQNGFYAWNSAAMANDVQGWLDAPSTNDGWFLRGGEVGNKLAKRFNSREDSDPTRHPILTVTYDPPGQGGACCQFGGDICTQETADDCANVVGGVFQGVGVPCTLGLCADPVGACCDPLGVCTEDTQLNCQATGGAYQGDGEQCSLIECPIVLEPFVDPLPIPRAAVPVAGTSGSAATYEFVMQEVQQQLHRDTPSVTVWGYGDDPNTTSASYPGPTIEAFTDQPVSIRYFNDLRDTSQAGSPLRTSHYLPVDTCPHGANDQSVRTVVHLHGGHVKQEFDGYPESTFSPGEEAAVCVTEPLLTCMTDADCPAPGTCDGDGFSCTTDADCVGHGGAENCLLCEPGYLYPNNQQAATLWFHDHALGITRLNVYMGMAAFYLIRDTVEQGLGLPGPAPQVGDAPGTTYYEIPIAIQDRSFRGNPTDGFSLKYPDAWQENFFGDTALVNGKVWPFLEVDQGKYRFRLLNGSNSRRYSLSLDRLGVGGTQDLPFYQIGAGGGLLPAPVELYEITLGPAERADVIVDFACADPPACTTSLPPGTEIVLANSDPSPFVAIPEIMKFVVGNDVGFTGPVPTTLPPIEVLDPADSVRTRQFLLRKISEACAGQEWVIKSRSEQGVDVGELWDDITEFPQLGTTEIWEFANPTVVPHPMHMHLVFFQVLNREDFTIVNDQIVPGGNPVTPPPEEAGWKDTARAEPGQILRVIARFEDYAGKYAYHCHILEHEDHEMMRQFLTITGTEVAFDDPDNVSWSAVPGATGYDVVRGFLGTLRSSGGDFTAATDTCLVNGLLTLSLTDSSTPNPGDGYWYLIRNRDAVGTATYDSGSSSQVGLRDGEVQASGNDCM